MKKVLIIILCVVFICGLFAGCGNKNPYEKLLLPDSIEFGMHKAELLKIYENEIVTEDLYGGINVTPKKMLDKNWDLAEGYYISNIRVYFDDEKDMLRSVSYFMHFSANKKEANGEKVSIFTYKEIKNLLIKNYSGPVVEKEDYGVDTCWETENMYIVLSTADNDADTDISLEYITKYNTKDDFLDTYR